MKWVTRKNANVDRVACPWLIRRFVDTDPEFLYVPADEVAAVAEREGAIPYDVPGVELGHVDGRCSFELIIVKYGLQDRGLELLARIVHSHGSWSGPRPGTSTLVPAPPCSSSSRRAARR